MSELTNINYTKGDRPGFDVVEPDKKPLKFQPLTEADLEYIKAKKDVKSAFRISKDLNDKADPAWVEIKITEIEDKEKGNK
jgi:hypothetical protein